MHLLMHLLLRIQHHQSPRPCMHTAEIGAQAGTSLCHAPAARSANSCEFCTGCSNCANNYCGNARSKAKTVIQPAPAVATASATSADDSASPRRNVIADTVITYEESEEPEPIAAVEYTEIDEVWSALLDHLQERHTPHLFSAAVNVHSAFSLARRAGDRGQRDAA